MLEHLPIRFAARPSDVAETDVSVDGAFGSRTRSRVHLAHWPGNRTPAELRRDLSTEIALAYVDLDEPRQRELMDGATALSINHYDTDGLCALYALARPEDAKRHRELLVDVAAAGDFFEVRSERAFAIDAALLRFAKANRGVEKQQLIEDGLELLGRLLDDPEHAPELWREDVDALAHDRADLESAVFDDLVYMDLGIWTAAKDATSSRGAERFDPGRHAMFASGRVDRVLSLGPSSAGTTARFVLGTRSFFDLVSREGSPRPDLPKLAERLNGLEGTSGDVCWRAQDMQGASPELWFGTDELPFYAEHADRALRPSALPTETIKREVLDAVRAVWPLPGDDDEAEDGEDVFAV